MYLTFKVSSQALRHTHKSTSESSSDKTTLETDTRVVLIVGLSFTRQHRKYNCFGAENEWS